MRLSIVTINYNNLAGLRKTMESVFSQTCKDFEYIVIDGASTDGSAEYVRTQADKLTYWVSEPDTGIYNAMNKGVRAATGEYVLMLNSADSLVDEYVIARIMPELDGTDIVQGNTIEDHNDEQWRNRGYGRSNISFLDVQRGHFLHQASFCKRDLFDKYGYFDESYRYVSDTIFFIKTLGYGGATFRYVDIDIANFDLTGFSCTNDERIRQQHWQEEQRMQHELFPGRLYDFCRDSEKKVQLYDELKSQPLIWKLVVLLKIITNHINQRTWRSNR